MKPELLAPAGNFEKLKAAVLYGADAVYIGGPAFGMRAAADNFTLEEIYEAVKYTHERGAKLYLTVNTMPRDGEYRALEEYFDALSQSGIDAVIAADLGVVELVKQKLPHTDIHISTQASVVSSAACLAWQRLGAKRIVLARELPLRAIKEIVKNIPKELEIETFVHGSMCIAYSGRCLLSQFLTGRDANKGMCAQPCRWNYSGVEISEEKRPEISMPLEQDKNGTFIMSSKDMCMIEHIPELMESGIKSFKIEGRMKSAYYTALTTNAYRIAMDQYMKDPANYRFDRRLLHELDCVSHREYCTGFYYDDPLNEANTCTVPGYLKEKAYFAIAESYDEESGTACFLQRNKLSVGDKAELMSPGSVGIPFTVDNMKNEAGEDISSAPHPSMRFYIKTSFPVKEGDILREG